MPRVEGIEAEARTFPTDGSGGTESDGTLEWEETTIVLARVRAGGETGIGYTYADASVAALIEGKLAGAIEGRDALATAECWQAMHAALRNAGQAGAGAMALSAVDLALHDLRGRLLGAPVHRLLGTARDAVPIYASGGFCSWSSERLRAWCAEVASAGRVKIKVGREPERDAERVRVAREGAGDAELMADANGAYATVAEAARWARLLADAGVRWLEEPLSSDDLAGLRALRARAPAGMAIAAGEYGWSAFDARRMLEAGAVDVLQLDVTRCGGITGALAIDALAWAHGVPTSLHCAPAASVPAGAAMRTLAHLEHFHDHVRIEDEVFVDAPVPDGGALRPSERPGLGLEVRP
jgi:L-alanine-DL-glutamate epimerase-like enolase superfamily enzyme